MITSRPRVISGIQPTADSFHLGNYLGAVQHWAAMQDQYEAFYCIVDLHALTARPEASVLEERTRLAAAQLLAADVDPTRSVLFVQSHVAEHVQLGWILGCLTEIDAAANVPHFKEKVRNLDPRKPSLGLLNFPVQQAADILLYRAELVPVGEDLRGNLDLARELATIFNQAFGPVLTVPRTYVSAQTARILDLQNPTTKMSKSASTHAGVINLLEDPHINAEKIIYATTEDDPEVSFDPVARPAVSNLMTIYSSLTGTMLQDVATTYQGLTTRHLKNDLARIVTSFGMSFREQVSTTLAHPERIDALLSAGAAKARMIAAQTLDDVYRAVGLLSTLGH